MVIVLTGNVFQQNALGYSERLGTHRAQTHALRDPGTIVYPLILCANCELVWKERGGNEPCARTCYRPTR